MFHFILALLTLAFSASPPQPWYFGQLNSTNEVIAFTSSGQMNDLHISGDAQFGVRADAQNALFVMTDSSSKAHLYHVTPDKATEITVPGGADQLRQALAASGNYVVLRTDSVLPSQTFLIDLASDQAVPLMGQVPQLARISSDGKLLRYMSSDGSHWSLLERTLASGQERIIYTIASTDPAPIIYADSFGERWIYADNPKSGFPIYTMISAAGIVTHPNQTADQYYTLWRFFHNDLISYAADCITQCAFVLHSASSDVTIPLPAADGYTPLAEPQPGTLLAFDSKFNFWLLRSGHTPLKLAAYDPTRIFMTVPQLISPDGRYLLTQSGDDQFSVIDLTSAKPVAQISGKFLGQIFYSDQGFTIHTYGATTGSDQAIAYRYSDGKTITLPNAGTSLYVDLLPDGTLLDWLQANTAGVGDRGIYRYDPSAQKYTVLIANGRVLVAHSVS